MFAGLKFIVIRYAVIVLVMKWIKLKSEVMWHLRNSAHMESIKCTNDERTQVLHHVHIRTFYE